MNLKQTCFFFIGRANQSLYHSVIGTSRPKCGRQRRNRRQRRKKTPRRTSSKKRQRTVQNFTRRS